MSDTERDEVYEKAEKLFDEGRFEEAVDAFTEIIDHSPHLLGAWGSRGRALYELGYDEDALDDFEMVIELDIADPFGHGFRALTLRNLGRYEEALSASAEAFEAAPEGEEVAPARLARGWLFAQAGQYAAAYEDLEIFLGESGHQCIEPLLELCKQVSETGDRTCERGPGGVLNCGACQYADCGYSFNTTPNSDWETEGGRCPWSHCIMVMPHREGDGAGVCPVYGHDCPGGAEMVDSCVVEPDDPDYYDHPGGKWGYGDLKDPFIDCGDIDPPFDVDGDDASQSIT